MSGGGTELNPTHVAVWGGMLSTGQLVGVGFLQMATDALGRKVAMHITWVTLCVVGWLKIRPFVLTLYGCLADTTSSRWR